MNSVLEGRPALKKEVEKIAEVAGYLWQNGWAERNGGNITVNITDLVDDEIRHLPAIGLVECADDLQQGSLSGSRWAYDGDNLSLTDLQVDALEHLQIAE